jgi:CheY-like chemotaxis protein
MYKHSWSIKTKVVFWSTIIILVIGSVLIGYSSWHSRSMEMDSRKMMLEDSAMNTKLKIEKTLSQAADANEAIASMAMSIRSNDLVVNKREVLESFIGDFIQNHPEIIGVNIAFESNAFDQQDAEYIGDSKYGADGRYMPYLSLDGSKRSIRAIENLETAAYYLDARAAGETIATEAYYGNVRGSKVLMSTISKPLYEGSIFIGIVGVDLSVEYMTQVANELANENERIVMLTEGGEVIANNTDRILQSADIERIMSGIKAANGANISRMHDIHYEVISNINARGVVTTWYLLLDMESRYLTEASSKATYQGIGIGLLTMLLALLFLWFITNRITTPISRFVLKMNGFTMDNIQEDLSTEDTSLTEVNSLTNSYQSLLEKLRENLVERDRKEGIQIGQMKVNEIAQANNQLQNLSNQLITFITKNIQGQLGVLYLLNEKEEPNQYELLSSYAYKRRKGIPESFKMGEGLIGQAAMENETILISELPDDYISIHSGVGYTSPKHIAIIPCEYNGKVIAVMEVASVNEITEEALEFLNLVKVSAAIAINNILNYQEVEILLEEARENAIQLQNQQEELRVINEELEEQSISLKSSQAELESQQEELRVSNEELEESTKLLEFQKKELEENNQALESTQDEIQEKAKQLVLSNQYKSEFLANMSHELRTPLNSILILSELLREQDQNLTKDQIEFAQTINSSGKDLLKLINDILDLSKVEAGKVDVEIDSIRLSDLKAEMEGLFSQLALQKGVHFELSISERLSDQVMLDEMKVKQILKNLLSNAFKFTKKGSVSLSIKPVEHEIHFEVSDTGIGISKEKQHSIFEAFQQEDGSISREFGGTGLGLSISMQYANLLGGRLEVKSNKNQGSRFVLVLPLVEDTSVGSLSGKEKLNDKKIREIDFEGIQDFDENPIEQIYIPDDRQKIKDDDKVILIIEDDLNFAKVMKEISRAKEFKTIIAETGENGLYLADYFIPTGIILDIGLPGINGWEVMEKLKANKRTKDIPVYVISGKEREMDEDWDLNFQFFSKPVNKDQIEEILDRALAVGGDVNSILVVEDNAIQNDAILSLIANHYQKMKTYSAVSGADALQVLAEYSIDLIILDLGLLDYDGFDFVEKLKSIDEFKNIPIIVYTGREVTVSEEKNLREKVGKIIIKGDQSSQRLVDEIKLFVHNVKNNRLRNVRNNEIEEVFLDKTILIVDDDMRNVFALSSILEGRGMKTKVATNGVEAIEILEQEPDVNLVLMDIMMPVMDGYEAMRRIRTKPAFQELPIIALTAKAMRGDREICLEAGANEYLAKPIDKDKLLSLLRVWV